MAFSATSSVWYGCRQNCGNGFRRQLRPFFWKWLKPSPACNAGLRSWKLGWGGIPQNSSLPPCNEHPHAKQPKPRRNPSARQRGAQKGHKKHQRPLVSPEQVTETIALKPPLCRRCGRTLKGNDPQPLRHQVFEFPEIQPIITEYQRHRLECACCGVSTTAVLPDGVPKVQSGPRLTAFAALLMAYFRQSKRRTALFLEAVCNIPCSVGLTVELQKTTTRALGPCYEQMRQALPAFSIASASRGPLVSTLFNPQHCPTIGVHYPLPDGLRNLHNRWISFSTAGHRFSACIDWSKSSCFSQAIPFLVHRTRSALRGHIRLRSLASRDMRMRSACDFVSRVGAAPNRPPGGAGCVTVTWAT